MPRVTRAFEQLGIRASSPSAPVASLSGGNQQKVVLGKWLETGPRVLLLDEPTRGVDVGAKYEIYRLLNDLRKQSIAILISSSEVPELNLLCDRVVVMCEGRVAAALPGTDVTEGRIAALASGELR
jgi:ABC-type sugar transport system ATPase subunit